MLDKPRDRTLYKKLLISAMVISGLGAMTESTYSILGLMVGWAGVLLIAWAIIFAIHWFAEEEVGDAKP